MEPSEFDKILREKVLDSQDIHQQEIEAAKPFVWSAVYNEIGRKRSLTWYHLAAAVVLLLISFSVVMINLQNSHQKELADLSGKIDQLEQNYINQAALLQSKDTQLASIKGKLENVEVHFANLDEQKVLSPKETIIYQTDTVFVKQVEYVTIVQEPKVPEQLLTTNRSKDQGSATFVQLKKHETDDVIFPSNGFNNKKENSESTKIKFSPFTTRSN